MLVLERHMPVVNLKEHQREYENYDDSDASESHDQPETRFVGKFLFDIHLLFDAGLAASVRATI